MITDIELLEQEKRALERLNPRWLSSGLTVNRVVVPTRIPRSGKAPGSWENVCVPCAIGAFYLHLMTDKPIPNAMDSSLMESRMYQLYQDARWSIPDMTGDAHKVRDDVINVNELFSGGANTPEDMSARWKHVYAVVCRKIKQLKAKQRKEKRESTNLALLA